METPKVIYVQKGAKQRTEKKYDNDVAYFSEELVQCALIEIFHEINTQNLRMFTPRTFNIKQSMCFIMNNLRNGNYPSEKWKNIEKLQNIPEEKQIELAQEMERQIEKVIIENNIKLSKYYK